MLRFFIDYDHEQSLYLLLSSSIVEQWKRHRESRRAELERGKTRIHFLFLFSSTQFSRAGFPIPFRGSTNSRGKIETARSLFFISLFTVQCFAFQFDICYKGVISAAFCFIFWHHFTNSFTSITPFSTQIKK